MPGIRLVLDGDHQRLAHELNLDKIPVVHTLAEWTVDVMREGMQSGATSLTAIIPIRIDNTTHMVLAETSLQCWMMASSALAAACADEIEKPGWAQLNPAARDLLRPRLAEAVRRAVPTATPQQADHAAEMLLDGLAADAPPNTDQQAG